MLAARPILATYAQALARSILLALGLDHPLIDFLAHTFVGSVTILLAILFVAIHVRRHRRRVDGKRLPLALQSNLCRSYDDRPSGGPS